MAERHKFDEDPDRRFVIPDFRCYSPSCYEDKVRRGRMKASWHIGVAQRQNGTEAIEFNWGVTWGSIGQYLGYLFGEVDEAFKDELYERMERAFWGTDRWVSGGNERE